MMILHFLCRLEQTIFYMKQEIEQKELGMETSKVIRLC